MKVLIGLPSSDGKFHGEMMISLIHQLSGMTVDFLPVYRQRIASARNNICTKFLELDHDYLLFMDDDNPVEKGTLKKFIELDKDIVTAVIVQRGRIENACVMKYEEVDGMIRFMKYKTALVPKEVFKVDACGMGFCLIKRKVIEKMNDKFKEFYGEMVQDVSFENYNSTVNIGEDLSFCIRAKKLGFEIYADPTVWTEHIDIPKVARFGGK